jgi:hypothetical protein
MNDEGRVLDGKDRQEGGPVDVMGRDERYWMRFLKGMFTDRNTSHAFAFPSGRGFVISLSSNSRLTLLRISPFTIATHIPRERYMIAHKLPPHPTKTVGDMACG